MGFINKGISGNHAVKESKEREIGRIDIFGKKEIADLQGKVTSLESQLAKTNALLTPELQDIGRAQDLLQALNESEAQQRETISQNNALIAQLDDEIKAKRAQIITFDDNILVQEFGLYEPRFDFANSTQFSDKLKDVRSKQKEMTKKGIACSGSTTWQVNGNAAKGRKMVKDTQKLLMKAFNSECDETVRKVKYANVDASLKSIDRSAQSINKLGTTMSISISPEYVQSKKDEVQLAFEFQQAKQREKDEAREMREQEREEAKLRKEIETQRKKLAKEKDQYEKALADIERSLRTCSENDRPLFLAKREELAANIDEVDKGIADVDYREANARAGYVYVISNIGSFGGDVFKIGMTRRLEPMDRINELGDASVPFNFDVHAMIFTDDAPGLETALHNRFADRKLNLVNQRREFFKCSLDEIKDAVKQNYDQTVEFYEVPDAEQYRVSEKMRGE
jgi:predicted  nucleic acid-binding Zn-ribbon protein